MGEVDREKWVDGFRRGQGCVCLYCSGRFNWLNESMIDSSGNFYPMGKIPNGKIQIIGKQGDLKFPRYVTTPGCHVIFPELSPEQQPGAVGFTGARFVTESCVKTGFICTGCKMKNDYAAANQSDGSYKCYECR